MFVDLPHQVPKLYRKFFEIDGKRILVEHVPATSCSNCGELTFSRAATEKVRRMLHGDAAPIGVVELEVFEFA